MNWQEKSLIFAARIGPGALLLVLLATVEIPVMAAGDPAASGELGIDAQFIDTHTHLARNFRRGGAQQWVKEALRVMNDFHVRMAIIMPPPFPAQRRQTYGFEDFIHAIEEPPGRFAFLGGGGSLNPIIQDTPEEEVTPVIVRRFKQEAGAITRAGAAGFGEMAAEHFSSGRGHHPYESVQPDHPLFLLLADLAADHGLPVELHMEAVPDDMEMPEKFAHHPNPSNLKGNIAAFVRLLRHNRKATIVWAHAGWDNTGRRTPELMRRLLRQNSNLYMNIKIDRGRRRNRPLDENGTIRPGWLKLFQEFPKRFMIGSDQFFDSEPSRMTLARDFLRQLPENLKRQIGYENALSVYRLKRLDGNP